MLHLTDMFSSVPEYVHAANLAFFLGRTIAEYRALAAVDAVELIDAIAGGVTL